MKIRRNHAALGPGQEFANRPLTDAGKGYTRADFRAKRESLGLSAADVARELDVDERSVNRWERGAIGKDQMPAPFAWAYLEGYAAMRAPLAAMIHDRALAEQGDEDEIILRYWRNQSEYAEATGDTRAAGFRNVCTRDAAERLRDEGHAVALRFAREDDVEYVFDEDASWIEVED